jgi:hypothetical protein
MPPSLFIFLISVRSQPTPKECMPSTGEFSFHGHAWAVKPRLSNFHQDWCFLGVTAQSDLGTSTRHTRDFRRKTIFIYTSYSTCNSTTQLSALVSPHPQSVTPPHPLHPPTYEACKISMKHKCLLVPPHPRSVTSSYPFHPPTYEACKISMKNKCLLVSAHPQSVTPPKPLPSAHLWSLQN